MGRQKKDKPMKIRSYRDRFEIAPYLLLLPVFALFMMFTFIPFFKTIVLSFAYTNKRGAFTSWAGIDNFIRVFNGARFGKIMGNTFKFAALVGVGTLTTSGILALLSATRERGSRLYEVMFSIPMAVASVPASIIFEFLMRKENGIFNALLGTNIAWLQDTKWAMLSVAFVTVWLHIGTSFIYLLVGFRNVPQELIECATLDGAGPVRKAFKLFIPLASPQIFFVVFLNINTSFKAFGQIKLLTGGGPNYATHTIVYEMYQHAMLNQRFETACVDALILFSILFIANRLQNALENKVVFYK